MPASGPLVSFPYHPCVPAEEQDVKVPAWLNDVSLYHNRGNTTFVGENSQYGDFFGLDDLFTENRRVVDGMIDIYKTWIHDFRIDGFRMDTMKHVEDEFWQKFAPAIESYAKSQGIARLLHVRRGRGGHEPADHLALHDPRRRAGRAGLPVPDGGDEVRELGADRRPAARSSATTTGTPTATRTSTTCRPSSGTTTGGGSACSSATRTRAATEAELLQRDRLAHALMYFSRGNPVVYYGDEQGFTGNGGDQDARQDMFPSQSPQYNNRGRPIPGDDGAGKNDNIGSDETPMDDNFDPSHPLYRELARLAAVTRRHPTLRNGTQQDRFSTSGPGVYAFSRINGSRRREYVVALNNAEEPASASIPTYVRNSRWEKVYGDGPGRLRSGRDRQPRRHARAAVRGRLPGAKQRIPRSRRAPSIALDVPAEGRDRLEVAREPRPDALLRGDVPREGRRRLVAGDRHGRQRAVPRLPRRVRHRAGHEACATARSCSTTRTTRARARCAAPGSRRPRSRCEAPTDEGRVRGTVEVRAIATPDHANHVVTFQRSVNGGPFTNVGTDESSPVYTVFDDTSSLPDGASVTYRAVLTYAPGRTVTSDTRTVTIVQARSRRRSSTTTGRPATTTAGACTCGATRSRDSVLASVALGQAVPADRHGRVRRGL